MTHCEPTRRLGRPVSSRVTHHAIRGALSRVSVAPGRVHWIAPDDGSDDCTAPGTVLSVHGAES